MRIAVGRRDEHWDRAALEQWLAACPAGLHVDIGTGDGRYAYEQAKRQPDRAVLGIDPDRESLIEYSHRASRKPARGGIGNVRYAVAALESLPPELDGLAGSVSIVLPWGSLLRAVATPDAALLRHVRATCRPGATLDVLFTYHEHLDPGEVARLELPALEGDVAARLRPGYEAAGFALEAATPLGNDGLQQTPSTWARRLGHGARERSAVHITARAI